jgi:class 3 adenylate cyclase
MTLPNEDQNRSHERSNSRENLERLLTEMFRNPERRIEITKTIENTFSQKKAILVLDMSGFSRTTHFYGIISFLLMIHQMQLICRPCIEGKRGKLIKADADNLFCIFDTVDDAVSAIREIKEKLNSANEDLSSEQHLYAKFGMGYGNILNVGDEDIFGDEVNLASKLGEDIAFKGEILLTSSARAELRGNDTRTREATISISGLYLTYYILES